MKIGDKVHCTAYVKKSGHGGISIFDCSPFFDFIEGSEDGLQHRLVSYYDDIKRDFVNIPYEEFTDATIDRFKSIEKEFDGIYVGTTSIPTKISAIYEEWGGGGSIRFKKICFEKFAVVYYANNKKRLVPIDCVKGGE